MGGVDCAAYSIVMFGRDCCGLVQSLFRPLLQGHALLTLRDFLRVVVQVRRSMRCLVQQVWIKLSSVAVIMVHSVQYVYETVWMGSRE